MSGSEVRGPGSDWSPYTAPSSPTTVPVRTGWLTTICIIAIVLSSLGLIVGLFTLFGLVANQAMQGAFQNLGAAGQPAEFMRLQQEAQAEILRVQQRWAVWNWALVLVLFVVAGTMLTSGILALSRRPTGRRMLVGVFMAAIVFEAVRTPVGVMQQRATVNVMTEYMPRITQAQLRGQPAPPGVAQTMGTVAGVGMAIALVFTVLVAAVKVGFYVAGAMYLQRPQIVALYEPSNAGAAGDVLVRQ